jgi:hypothetical protein
MTVSEFLQPPLSLALAILLAFFAVLIGRHGAMLFCAGLRSSGEWSGPLNIIRGIRSGIISTIMIGWAVCFFLEHTSALAIGAVILGEEIYETGVLILILRFGQKFA